MKNERKRNITQSCDKENDRVLRKFASPVLPYAAPGRLTAAA